MSVLIWFRSVPFLDHGVIIGGDVAQYVSLHGLRLEAGKSRPKRSVFSLGSDTNDMLVRRVRIFRE